MDELKYYSSNLLNYIALYFAGIGIFYIGEINNRIIPYVAGIVIVCFTFLLFIIEIISIGIYLIKQRKKRYIQ